MDSNPENRKIEIGEETLKHLNKLRKWTMFLAVSGFIFFGIIIVLGLITGTFLTTFNHSDKTPGLSDALVVTGFIALALLTFFPVFFLFRFSKHASNALTTLDRKNMHKAIKSLKRFFIYIGILLITGVVIYIFSLILAGRSAASLLGL
jgi:hypothetical protein